MSVELIATAITLGLAIISGIGWLFRLEAKANRCSDDDESIRTELKTMEERLQAEIDRVDSEANAKVDRIERIIEKGFERLGGEIQALSNRLWDGQAERRKAT